jgi:hypothetical protein
MRRPQTAAVADQWRVAQSASGLWLCTTHNLLQFCRLMLDTTSLDAGLRVAKLRLPFLLARPDYRFDSTLLLFSSPHADVFDLIPRNKGVDTRRLLHSEAPRCQIPIIESIHRSSRHPDVIPRVESSENSATTRPIDRERVFQEKIGVSIRCQAKCRLS